MHVDVHVHTGEALFWSFSEAIMITEHPGWLDLLAQFLTNYKLHVWTKSTSDGQSTSGGLITSSRVDCSIAKMVQVDPSAL